MTLANTSDILTAIIATQAEISPGHFWPNPGYLVMYNIHIWARRVETGDGGGV